MHGVQKKEETNINSTFVIQFICLQMCRSEKHDLELAYCLFFPVLKFCADRKKAKLKIGTLAIWEAFFEANVTNNDNKTGNIQYLGQMLSILDHEM